MSDNPAADIPVMTPNETNALNQKLISEIENMGQKWRQVRQQISQVIYGQDHVIEEVLVCLLSGGHVLLVGVPGLAKTKLMETLGAVLHIDTQRIQCTPDLMPADILGSEVLEESPDGKRNFRFIKGPVFTQLLMADEINRASPRTQSALLQAMQEREVTIAGQPHSLPQPFHVLATQNPIEHEGTYPLPEAQLDRFLMQVDIGYPGIDAERRMMLMTTGAEIPQAQGVLHASELIEAQNLVRRLPVGEDVVEAILQLVRNARPEMSDLANVRHHISWGPGPRASQSLMLAVRARALMDGRYAPSLYDVIALAVPILRHRMALSFAARADGIELETILTELLAPLKD